MSKKMRLRHLFLAFAFFSFLNSTIAQSVGVFSGNALLKSTAEPTYSQTMSLGAWIYLNNVSGNHTVASWNCSSGQIFFRTEGSNLYFRMWNGSATAIKNKTTLAANKWYYLSFVLNAGKVSLYINGLEDTEPTAAAGSNSFPALGTTASFAIGSTASTNADYHSGNIDNLSFWNSALTAQNISDAMNQTLTGTESNLGLLVNFESTPIYDLSSNHYSLLNTNVTLASSTLNRTQSQTVTFNPIPNMTTSDAAYTLSASASSGLGISYTSSNTAVASISGGKLYPTGPGTATITALQPGNDQYSSSNAATQQVTVNGVYRNYVVNLTGSNYLYPTNGTAAPFGTTFTISAWIKAQSGSERTIASWASGSSSNIGNFFRLESDNSLYYGQYNGSFKKIRSNTSIPNGVWTHVAMVKDNNTVRFYINGVEDDGAYTSGSAPMDNNSSGDKFAFGALNQNGSPSQFLTGQIDNATFFTSARTTTELQSEYTNGLMGTESNLWGLWKFNDQANPTADSSGNNRTLTLSTASFSESDIDVTPVLDTIYNGFVGNTSARVYVNSSTFTGRVYWALYPQGTSVTDPNNIKNGTGAIQTGYLDFSTPTIMDFFLLKALQPATGYILYATMQGSRELSAIKSTTFTTLNVVTDISTQVEQAKGVLSRLIPSATNAIDLSAITAISDNQDVFEIYNASSGKIGVRGSSATAILSGVRYYLNKYCNVSFSWSGDQIKLPATLPSVTGTIHKETPYQHRYSFNYTTYNYTMAFWDWKRWEREIDLMAMDGVNLVLAPIGSEAIWQNVLSHFGYSFEDIQSFIAGPGYTAWWLMGNLEGEGGKVSQAYINSRITLENQILTRLRALGMNPVLQGYAGMAPTNFASKVPAATVNTQPYWATYQRPPVITGAYCDSLAKYWYIESEKLFGKSDFYGGDVFHEGGTIPSGLNLSTYATQLQGWMFKTNPNATWLLQAWQTNPKTEFLKGLKKDQCIILDYSNDVYGFWKSRAGFNGYPWIYGVINNFGGRMGIYGRLQKVASDIYTMQHSSIKGNNWGIGVAPEASIYNPVSYDIIWDLAWDTTAINTDTWIQGYADSRYGVNLDNTRKTWQVLNQTALNCNSSQEGGTESIFNLRPTIASNPSVSCCATTANYYANKDIIPAWLHMLNSIDVLKTDTTFKHDIVDISRQVLTNFGKDIYQKITSAVNSSDLTTFNTQTDLLLSMMLDQDSLLRSNIEYSLGKWVKDARDMGNTASESDLFELNARALPTTWSTSKNDGLLHDYAHHEWAGLTKDFYRERWKIYIQALKNNNLNTSATSVDFFNVFEKGWINKKGNGYDTASTNNEIKMAQYIYKKYFPMLGYTLTNNTPIVPYQTYAIPSYSKSNALVGKVYATDPDNGQTLSYSIYTQENTGLFSINASTGEIKVSDNSSLINYIGNPYKLIVKVQDNGTPSYAVYREIIVNIGTQNGPGGIGKNNASSTLSVWLDGSDLNNGATNNLSNGQAIQNWSDKSGNANTFTSGDNAPTYSVVNNTGAVVFASSNNQFMNASITKNLPFGSAYLVSNLLANASGQSFIEGTESAFKGVISTTNNVLGYSQNNSDIYSSTLTPIYGSNSIYILRKQEDSSQLEIGINAYKNKITLANATASIPINRIGSFTSNNAINGSLSEMIIHNDTLNYAQRIILENYLKSKYSISTIKNPIYNNDISANGLYKYNVAGIGRLDGMNQQNYARGTGLIELSQPTNVTDNSFLIWGDDGNNVIFNNTTDIPTDVRSRLARTWRFSARDSSNQVKSFGTVNLAVDLSQFATIDPSTIRLVIDANNNGIFTDETAISGASSLGNNTFLFENISNIVDGNRITFAITTETTLPVKLLNFNAVPVNNSMVNLNWHTGYETGFRQFNIEHSMDANHWKNIGTVSAKGNYSQYTFDDKNPTNGINYYRLLMLDVNGEYNYSPLRTVSITKKSGLSVYPNPTRSTIFLTINKSVSTSAIRIYNTVGTDVTPLISINNSGNNSPITFNISKLSQGAYYIVAGDTKVSFIKL